MVRTLRLFRRAVLTSYWFVPSLMALGAAALSFGAVALDQTLNLAWLEGSPWLYASTPDGARAVLSTVAGSASTVAGVAFSITTVAVAQTAARYGPRLLTNFMQDRGNQITLGTLIGTFLYGLLVLRSVRNADGSIESFVPHIAVLGALVLAFASLAVLIYFLHHVTQSLHISNIVAGLGHGLDRAIDARFPAKLGRPGGERRDDRATDGGDPAAAAWCAEDGAPIEADRNGYIQSLDIEALMRRARADDLVLRLECRPGDFVRRGEVLAYAWPAAQASKGKAAGGVRDAFAVGAYRGEVQDAMYLVDRLVEVAAKALSPGVNDVFTATNALDWLAAALAKLAGQEVPEARRYDEQGRLRVIAPRSYSFEDFVDAAFDRLRPYVEADRTAAVEMMGAIAKVAQATEAEDRRRLLLTHAEALREGCARTLAHERDRQAVEAGYGAVVRLLRGGDDAAAGRRQR